MAVVGAIESFVKLVEEAYGTMHVTVEHTERTLRSSIGKILACKVGLSHLD